ncbi:hypothetical protein HCR_22920 (plasmid) [Hydrogenimonas cancrithermarum]|uniref:Uncharacterized protein n=2 Tax=Hydrogenimonas cancrithermarum TaxID=2993563 RepID=A0ABN6WZT4_9BACT|nr:hypothetical protein HCR_22920 [Hydrogenimonas cancrithermarum]
MGKDDKLDTDLWSRTSPPTKIEKGSSVGVFNLEAGGQSMLSDHIGIFLYYVYDAALRVRHGRNQCGGLDLGWKLFRFVV